MRLSFKADRGGTSDGGDGNGDELVFLRRVFRVKCECVCLHITLTLRNKTFTTNIHAHASVTFAQGILESATWQQFFFPLQFRAKYEYT